jgi:indolepyruvate ferredoxin oxidoreductase beta subunit
MSDPVTTVRLAAWPKSSVLKADPAEDVFNVLIVGVGGQGVIMVSKVLALLAQSQGFEVKQSEVHGMAKRGGSVFSHVRFGKRVWSPTIPKGDVDILIALEWAEGLRWLPYLKRGAGIFICDTKRIVPPFACLNRRPAAPMRYSKETPAEVVAHVGEAYAIDATEMAEQLGNERVANVVLLGALSTALEFSTTDWERTVAEFVPKKTLRSIWRRSAAVAVGLKRRATSRRRWRRPWWKHRHWPDPPIARVSTSMPPGARAAISA